MCLTWHCCCSCLQAAPNVTPGIYVNAVVYTSENMVSVDLLQQ